MGEKQNRPFQHGLVCWEYYEKEDVPFRIQCISTTVPVSTATF